MRITIVYRYFWPETMLPNDIARWLAEAGHDVEVITAQPSYNPEAKLPKQPRRESWNGVTIRRVPLFDEKKRGLARYVNSALFILLAALVVLFGKQRDVVWTTSIPPVVQPFALRIASQIRGAKFVYFLQDIYPEIGLAMNMLKEGMLTRMLRAMDVWTMNRSDALVTLSRDMAEVIHDRGVLARDLRIINNFTAVSREGQAGPMRDGPARFVFAGNIGRFQNLEWLVDVFAGIDPDIAILEILGEGRAKAGLQAMVLARDIRSVRFHKALPVTEAFDFMRGCDVGVVSLTPGLYRYAYPSKTFTYLAAGLPILALVEADSELAVETGRRRIGITVDWSGPDENIAEAIRQLASWNDMAGAIRERSLDMYDQEAARAKWLALFEYLGRRGPLGDDRVATDGISD